MPVRRTIAVGPGDKEAGQRFGARKTREKGKGTQKERHAVAAVREWGSVSKVSHGFDSVLTTYRPWLPALCIQTILLFYRSPAYSPFPVVRSRSSQNLECMTGGSLVNDTESRQLGNSALDLYKSVVRTGACGV